MISEERQYSKISDAVASRLLLVPLGTTIRPSLSLSLSLRQDEAEDRGSIAVTLYGTQ